MTEWSRKKAQGVVDHEVNKIMDEINAAMGAELKTKINWEHSKEWQGQWPRKTMVNLWFVHGTEIGMMIDTLRNVRNVLEEKQYVVQSEK